MVWYRTFKRNPSLPEERPQTRRDSCFALLRTSGASYVPPAGVPLA